MDHCPVHPSADVLILKAGMITSIFLQKNTIPMTQPTDQGIIQAFKAYCCCKLLGGVVNAELQIMEFLKTLVLKVVAYSFVLASEKLGQLLLQTSRRSVLENTTS